jgi:hypothetical protein
MASKKKAGPKMLFIDIETRPMLVYAWGLFDQTIALNQIKEDWCILSFAAKWGDDKKMFYADQSQVKDVNDDKKLLEEIWKLLDEADIVVGQNVKKFDVKKINARFFAHDMKEPSSYRVIDTLSIAKKKFALSSNKLEYMSHTFNEKYKKLSHKKFGGFSLWTECLAGNQEAWKEMEKYNKYDVLATEELYHKLAPWDNSINFGVYNDDEDQKCSCGSEKELDKKGFAYTAAGKFQRYRCVDCSKQYQSKQNLLSFEKRKSLKK